MKNILKLLNFTYDSNRENFYQLMYAIYVVHLYKIIDNSIFFSCVLISIRMLYNRRFNLFNIIFANYTILKL